MSVPPRLAVDLPDLSFSLDAGDAHLLAVDDAVAADAAVARLTGRRGPWRPGAVRVDGRAIGHRRTAARVRAGLVVVDDAPLAPEVPVRDHLAVAVAPARADAVLAAIPRLAGRGGDPAGVLSGGERRLLAWARAELRAPEVVVLDRASRGLDADALAWATGRVARWRREGAALVVRAGRAEEAAWAARQRPDGRVPGPRG